MTLNLHPDVYLPSDWGVKRLREVAKIQAGGTPSRSEPSYWDGTIPWVGTGKINFNCIAEADEFITEAGLVNSSARVFPVGTILLAMIGQGDTRGKVAILGIGAATNQNCVGILPEAQLCSAFLYQYLAGRYEAIRHFGDSGGISNLNAGLVGAFDIPIPPLSEQKTIAAVLSVWDRAIVQTAALIAAKQRLKQGLMQQLFGEAAHSQRRLESKLCHLGDVAAESTRRNAGGLGNDAVYSVTKANGMIPMPEDTIGSDMARYKLVRPKTFAYNPMRINIGSIARWEGRSEVLVSPDYVVFECGPELDPDYLNHFRRGHVWDSCVKRSGDGSVRVRIYFDHLSRMPIRLPDIEEQRRIARVLNAADAEHCLLERKLDALKQQKRGLMQQLLTGNVRVPESLVAAFRKETQPRSGYTTQPRVAQRTLGHARPDAGQP